MRRRRDPLHGQRDELAAILLRADPGMTLEDLGDRLGCRPRSLLNRARYPRLHRVRDHLAGLDMPEEAEVGDVRRDRRWNRRPMIERGHGAQS
jgi:hypothetical protein